MTLSRLQRDMRRRQLANQARRKKLEHVPLHDRRRYARDMDMTAACYTEHSRIKKADLRPFITPPKPAG